MSVTYPFDPIEADRLTPEPQAAWKRLETTLLKLHGKVIVAFSGGVDSAFLSFAVKQILGSKSLLCVLADSPSLARQESAEAQRFALEQGLPLQVIETTEMQNPDYVRNSADRCYHCKSDLFLHLSRLAQEKDARYLLYGANLDDVGDFRPGARAAEQFGVRAPLQEAGLKKTVIRRLAFELGLSLWDKPAKPCLSSRLAYGQEVRGERLHRIERAEAVLSRLGFREFRVRDVGSINFEIAFPHQLGMGNKDVARIEIATGEQTRLTDIGLKAKIEFEVLGEGFGQVIWMASGLHSGSLNSVLSEQEKQKALLG